MGKLLSAFILASFLTTSSGAWALKDNHKKQVKKRGASRAKITKKTQRTVPVVIKPKTKAKRKIDTSFRLYYDRRQNKLILSFYPPSSNIVLNHRAPIAIQINYEEPLNISPSIITSSNWPKNSNHVDLKFSGAKKNTPYLIKGEAAFTVCHRKTNVCGERISSFEYSLKI